jgi:multidrug efflux pump subunit AcrA (membrane-fusion protein)
MRSFVTLRRLAGLLSAVGVLLTAGFILHQPTESAQLSQTEESTALPIEVVVVHEVRSFDQTRHYTGALVARRIADVSFERSARVIEILVDEGDTVESGQALAKLDVRRLQTRQDMLEAQRDAAAAQLAELKAGPRLETIAAARAQVEELNAQLNLSRLTHARTERLQSRNSTSEQSVDNSRSSMEAAAARLAQAQHRLIELEAGTRAEQIATQQAMVDQLDAQMADVQLDRDDSILKSPFAGRIAMRYLDEGTVTAPGQPVLKIIESTEIEARIGLSTSSICRLTSGDDVELTVGDLKLSAQFTRVLPEVDLQTRTQIAIFELTQADSAQVAAGQTVRISLTEQTDATGYWLPTAALSPGQRGLWSAYAVVDRDGDSIIESRPVEVLHTEGERVLVAGTIRNEDRVVAGGVQRIIPGQKVSVAK